MPFSFAVHLVAARYGQRPGAVLAEWQADELMRAIAYESFMQRGEPGEQ